MFDFIIGKCEEVMPRLKAGSIDTVVTSPPYNRGVVYKTYVDKVDSGKYLNWTYRWCKEVRRLLSERGSLFLNLGGSPSNPWLPYEVILSLREMFVLQNVFHWVKAISFKDESRGHFKPINSDRYVNNCHEFVFHLTLDGDVKIDRKAIGVPYEDKSNIERWGHSNGSDLRCRGNNWFLPYQTIKSRNKQRPHPATFPVELAEFCIKLTNPQSVLDPFLGLGATAMAARKCDVARFTGIDIDPEYIDYSKQRVANAAIRNDRVKVISDQICAD